MNIHADYEDFIQIINEEQKIRSTVEELAPLIHERYRKNQKGKGQEINELVDKDFCDLSPSYQEDNIAAALRIQRILALVGLKATKATDVAKAEIQAQKYTELLENNIELLARAEHEGWMTQKKKAGWKKGDIRNDREKLHPLLIDYFDLPEEEKEKDRNSIRGIKDQLAQVGYKIVEL